MANNQLPTEQRNDFDIVQNISVSLKHLVKYKNGSAIYFLTRIYNNFNYHKDKRNKNRIFVELLRAQTESKKHQQYYFVEVFKTFGETFGFLDFDTDIKVDDRLPLIINHDIVSQTKNVNFGLGIDDTKYVETSLKTINDIEHWIESERCRTVPLGETPNDIAGLINGMVYAADYSVKTPNDIVNVINDDIVDKNYLSGVTDYQPCVFDGTTLNLGGSIVENILPIQPMPFPTEEWLIEQKEKTILIQKNKKKNKFVRANVEKTILLK